MEDDRQLDELIDGAVVVDLWGRRGSRLDASRRRSVVEAVKQRLAGDASTPVDVPLDETNSLRLALRAHVEQISSRESLLDAWLAVDTALDLVVSEETARRIAELEASALVDPLTGLGNRRAAVRAFETALASRAGHGGVVAVGLADLVGLKHLNDEYGHAAGDTALYGFASALRRSMRGADSAFRFGGDEFVVIAPGSTSSELANLFDRMRSEAPTFTVGVAEAPADGLTDVALLAAADARMYAQRRAHSVVAAPKPATMPGRRRHVSVGALALVLLLVVGPVLAQAVERDDDPTRAASRVPTTTATTARALRTATDPPRSGPSALDRTSAVAPPADVEVTTSTARAVTTTVAPRTVSPTTAATAPTVPHVEPTPVEAATPPTTTTPPPTTTPPVDDSEYEAADDDGEPGRGNKPKGKGNGEPHRGGRGKK